LALGCLLGCTPNDPGAKQVGKRPEEVVDTAGAGEVKPATAAEIAALSDAELEARIGREVESFCSACHALPQAAEAPREMWRDEVERAYGFQASSPRRREPAPDQEAVVAYFERRAMAYDDFSVPALGDADPGRLQFRKTTVHISDDLPAIAALSLVRLEPDAPPTLLACDMRRGGLFSIGPNGEYEPLVKPGSGALLNPCHVEPCDLDGDGLIDLVVADLGDFYPNDRLLGRVVWLKHSPAGGFEPIVLATALGRVADVQPADFDGDGDQDLLVAEFGLFESGSILLLKNLGVEGGRPRFEFQRVDPRHGTIHVPTADLNGDRRLDFVALISQEHEVVDAFLNQPDGTFERRQIYAAPNPSWGSTGIQLVDLDADGDLDLLCTNGDGYDRGYLKPYHSIQWLENMGSFPWLPHPLANVPGCHRALAGDLDGDGDLDIVAVALLRGEILARFGRERFDAVCWLEQTGPGRFRRRTLERSTCDHLALAMADFDADGDLDMAMGNFHIGDTKDATVPPALTIWWNETPGATQ
jgi:hypothetical protein